MIIGHTNLICENRVTLKAAGGAGSVKAVQVFIIPNRQAQSNRFCYFLLLICSVFLKDHNYQRFTRKRQIWHVM